MKAKALKVTISGSYRTADFKVVDFSNLSGFIPMQDEEIATMHIRGRYARIWIMNEPKYSQRLYSVRECYVDNLEACEHDFSYLGKDIRAMTQDELQDLATVKDLRIIPLYKVTSERHARTLAYAAYSEQILKEPVNYKVQGFNLTKQPPIVVTDSSWRRDTTKKLTNDEVMDGESIIGQEETRETSLTRTDLEQLARNQNIEFHPKISDAKLYERIYGKPMPSSAAA